MTRVGNHAPLTQIQKSTIRYGLEAAADDLPIEDFEAMLRLGVNFEIVTGPLRIERLGCLG